MWEMVVIGDSGKKKEEKYSHGGDSWFIISASPVWDAPHHNS